MAHKFDPKHKSKLDNPERRRLLPPGETLRKLGLRNGDVLADIGCGIGYFTLPAAELVGSDGQVFAVDLSREMLEELEQRSRDTGVTNIQTVLTEEGNLKLESGSATFALVSMVLHEVNQPMDFLREISAILSDEGRLAIIEWEKHSTAGGPPPEHRLAKEGVEQALHSVGFKHITTMELGTDFYAVLAEK